MYRGLWEKNGLARVPATEGGEERQSEIRAPIE